jgi:hypothetical protein
MWGNEEEYTVIACDGYRSICIGLERTACTIAKRIFI